jgi:hypothetical protein
MKFFEQKEKITFVLSIRDDFFKSFFSIAQDVDFCHVLQALSLVVSGCAEGIPVRMC